MSIRDKIAAYKVAVQEHVSDEIRMPLGTDAAFALLAELDLATLDRPERAAVALALNEAVGPLPEGSDAIQAWARRKDEAISALWEALEGQAIDGVTIIRRR